MPLTAGPSQPELHLLVCTQIVNQLIANHKAQQQAYTTSTKPPADVNLNGIRQKISKQHGLKSLPRLMDILAAVPEEWKAVLGSKLTIKPVRTASGASNSSLMVSSSSLPGLRLLMPATVLSTGHVLLLRCQCSVTFCSKPGLPLPDSHSLYSLSAGRRRRCHVQAAPVSARRHDWQYLRLLPRRA